MIASDIVNAIADTLLPVPYSDQLTRYHESCRSALSSVGITPFDDTGTLSERTVSLRNAFFDRVSRIDETRAAILASGYILPDNPIPLIKTLNNRRQLFSTITIDLMTAQTYVTALSDLSDVVDAVDSGEIDLTEKHGGTSQISSFEMSVDGLVESTTGDALADIIGYQPDADLIARSRALEALTALDFKKRRPSFIVIVEEPPTSGRLCRTVVWRRMHDASGYRITRRNVFTGEIKQSTYTRETAHAVSSQAAIEALSFYDDLDVTDVASVTDDGLEPDSLYTYSITGLQTSSGGARKTFEVPFSPIFISNEQLKLVTDDMAAQAKILGAPTSPYLSVAKVIYGDERYDWTLAAINFLAARVRGASDAEVRGSSYLGATFETVSSMLSAGHLVAPDDLMSIVTSVEDSVSTYGISQTIMDVLDATGTVLFLSSDDPAGFQSGPDGIDQATSGIGKVLSAIDPVSATIDPDMLMSSLASKSVYGTNNVEVVMYSKAQEVTDTKALTLSEIIGHEVIDVTTYAGISSMMRIIRIYHDRSGQRF